MSSKQDSALRQPQSESELPMKTWRVNGIVTGGKYLGTVEARTKEEAERAAWDSLEWSVGLCHHCSGECEDAEIHELLIDPENSK